MIPLAEILAPLTSGGCATTWWGRGPRNPPSLPKVKIDLTSDEVFVGPAATRPILHPYSDNDSLINTLVVQLLSEARGKRA